jgi:hypothetical protein
MRCACYGSLMSKLKAHYDGKVLVPDEPVDLPLNCPLDVEVRIATGERQPAGERPLLRMLAALEGLPANDEWPADGAAQHDHYLYGMPKRP